MKLLIISHTPHYHKGASIVGWGSTVLEIDHLASLFDEVVHLAPLHPGPAPNSSLPYRAKNVRLQPVKPAGGDAFRDKLGIIGRIPSWLAAMKREMRGADVLHIRCPAGISLLALLTARLWAKGKPTWVKYAGNWNSYPGQAFTYKFQRWYLGENFHKGIVSINGHWPNQPEHVFSFLNPSFSTGEYQHALNSAKEKRISMPVKLLFVGRLSEAKGVDKVLEIANQLQEIEFEFQLTLVGDSPERQAFEDYVRAHDLGEVVRFAGWQPKAALSMYYREAHLFILPSTSEGWPKVLSEAMAYGVVPIASAIASIPQFLNKTAAGLAIPPDDVEAHVDAILQYTQDAHLWKQASMNGVRASRLYTYEHYLVDVKSVFNHYWQIELNNHE